MYHDGAMIVFRAMYYLKKRKNDMPLRFEAWPRLQNFKSYHQHPLVQERQERTPVMITKMGVLDFDIEN